MAAAQHGEHVQESVLGLLAKHAGISTQGESY
jgi:hypothetical protein